jgi:PadR family transcriptional regulator PadR
MPYLCIMLDQSLNHQPVENAQSQMRKGVLELVVLASLAPAPAYPSDIISSLKESDLIVVEGTLYPLLTRLKNAGYLQYEWQESSSGPPRKYYSLTESGALLYQSLLTSWNQLVESVQKITQNQAAS